MGFDLVKRRWTFIAVSLIVITPGLISILLPGGLRPGIDFTSGSILTFRFDDPNVDQGSVRQAFSDLGHHEAIVQRSDDGTYIVRTAVLAPEVRDETGNVTGPSERARVEDGLRQKLGAITVLSFDQVSPIVAAEIVRNSILAVMAACVGIMLYLWWAFRHVKESWRYGVCAVIALIHDALIVIGVFSILGRLFAVELDSLFITAVMTVIGFSVHDTIVVFDRVRENSVRHQGEPFEDIVNHSLMQTLGRSFTTSLTVLLTLFTLYLFGGVTIRNFVLALLIGISAGTFSSLFNASMMLVIWEKGELSHIFGGRSRLPALGRA